MNKSDKNELVQMIDKVVSRRVDKVVSKRIAESEGRILEDMKQFTVAMVSQQTSDIRGDLGNIRGDFTRLEEKVDGIAAGMGTAFDASNEVVDGQLKNHEDRILRLEKRAATA